MAKIRSSIFSTQPLVGFGHSTVALILRLMTAGAMLSHGVPKLMAFSSLSSTFADPLGLGSTVSLVMAIAAEVGCSVMLILGLFTRLAILPLLFTMIMAYFVIHSVDGFAVKELAFLYMGLYVAIFALGSGRFSVDYLISRR